MSEQTPATLTEPLAKPKPKRINYALAGALIAQGVTLADAAPQVGAANGNTLRVGLQRKGVTAKATRSNNVALEKAERAVETVLDRMGTSSRLSVARIGARAAVRLEKQAAPKSIKDIREQVEVLAPLVSTLDRIHGWSNADAPGMVQVNILSGVVNEPLTQAEDKQEQCIDVESTPS